MSRFRKLAVTLIDACAIIGAFVFPLPAATAQESSGAWAEVAFDRLSDRQISPFAQAALAIRAADWKHAESANFVYHYFHSFIAAPAAAEAESFYRMIARDLEKETAQWERKCHIFIFEEAADWARFQQAGGLDPWTGGVHRGGELFLQRDPAVRWKGDTLAHEIAHLVVHRFFGPGIPLWLNEGYAEYSASRVYSSFQRARGYLSRPRSAAISAAAFMPVASLTGLLSYPTDVAQVGVFYDESERLVRFLSAADKRGFGLFFDAMAKGNRFETALGKGFGTRWSNADALEREFKTYAAKDTAPAMR